MTQPTESKDLLREEEVSDGINVIIDDRFGVIFPMASRPQVEYLILATNRAVRQKYVKLVP